MAELQLSQGLVALVDDEDYEDLNKYSWYARSNGGKNPKMYAARCVPGEWNTKSYLHRELMNAPKGMQVDHINGNSLDNRKENLRLCTRQQNLQNRIKTYSPTISRYKGVTYIGSNRNLKKPWSMCIENKYVKCYETEEEAAKAYDEAAKQIYGEFANLNFKEVLQK